MRRHHVRRQWGSKTRRKGGASSEAAQRDRRRTALRKCVSTGQNQGWLGVDPSPGGRGRQGSEWANTVPGH